MGLGLVAVQARRVTDACSWLQPVLSRWLPIESDPRQLPPFVSILTDLHFSSLAVSQDAVQEGTPTALPIKSNTESIKNVDQTPTLQSVRQPLKKRSLADSNRAKEKIMVWRCLCSKFETRVACPMILVEIAVALPAINVYRELRRQRRFPHEIGAPLVSSPSRYPWVAGSLRNQLIWRPSKKVF